MVAGAKANVQKTKGGSLSLSSQKHGKVIAKDNTVPWYKSPLLPLPSLLSGANNESSLRKHDSITLDFVAPGEKNISTDGTMNQTGLRPYMSKRVVTNTKGTAIFQKYLSNG